MSLIGAWASASGEFAVAPQQGECGSFPGGNGGFLQQLAQGTTGAQRVQLQSLAALPGAQFNAASFEQAARYSLADHRHKAHLPGRPGQTGFSLPIQRLRWRRRGGTDEIQFAAINVQLPINRFQTGFR